MSELNTQDIEPAHAWLGLISYWLVAAVLLIAAVIAGQIGVGADVAITPARLLAIAAGFLFLLGVFTWLHRRSIRFALRTHDFALEKGVLWCSQTVQPLCRVQHVELEQGPIEKRLGIASLKLFSAGTGAATFQVPGLPKADAERMRTVVLDYTTPDDA